MVFGSAVSMGTVGEEGGTSRWQTEPGLVSARAGRYIGTGCSLVGSHSIWYGVRTILALSSEGETGQDAFFRHQRAGNVTLDAHFTTDDLLEIIQQYEALQPQGPHDNVGDDGEQDEEDETFAAFQAAANLQRNVSQVIDDFLAERGGRTEDGQGRVPAAPEDMAAASSAPVPRMSEEEWHANKGKMNASQKAVFQGVQDHLRCSQQHASSGTPAPPPLHWFITGGAGVGKSFVMNLVRELIIRACGADVNAVKMTAPTGVAAFNISGVTLHQALKLPVQDGAADRGTAYRELEGERLEDLRASWRNVKYLIIDEISMVGQVNFDFVHRRLCEIFGVRLPFGGISVLAVGDFFQLPPVKSGWIFFSRLLKDHFRMKELTENQRQIDDTG
eukprot:jgi/Botrbrau1/10979/Bobra.0234s0004.1